MGEYGLKVKWFYHDTILNIQMKWVPDVIKNTSRTFLKTSESEEFIEHNIRGCQHKDVPYLSQNVADSKFRGRFLRERELERIHGQLP